MNVFKTIMSAIYYSKGVQKLSNNHDFEALNYFIKAAKYKVDYEVLIHKGLAEFFLSKYENSILTFQYALKLIESNERLNKDEKNYLSYFVLEELLAVFNITQKYENIELYENNFRNLKYNIDNISRRITRLFPLNQ